MMGSDDGRGTAEVCRDLTGEPILGPRQAALIDAVTRRLAGGPDPDGYAVPMSEPDFDAFHEVAVLIGLHQPDTRRAHRARHQDPADA